MPWKPRPTPTAEGWFEPTPQKLIEQLPATRARFGERSIEYVALLIELGDSHMKQGRLCNPRAQVSYETALKMLEMCGAETPEIAWVCGKLANVKNSSGDSFGAEADLDRAVRFWKEHSPANALTEAVSERHVVRREEDLLDLKKLNAFKQRKPPAV